jgi:hypothetical protein
VTVKLSAHLRNVRLLRLAAEQDVAAQEARLRLQRRHQ